MADNSAPSGPPHHHAPRPAYPHGVPVANERPSPFTMSEPTIMFSEGPPSEPSPIRTMTVGSLITELTAFAEFYEQATAAISSAGVFEDRWYLGYRDVNADVTRREFRATRDIDRVRGYVLSRYGQELTIGTARRVLGDLLAEMAMPFTEAETLSLGDAMDRLTTPTVATFVAPPTPYVTSPGRPSTPPDSPQGNAANKPSRDRQKDILAAIRAAKMPLTRPELVEGMRLKSEGKLGANLAWMVANNILVNFPQRGYWPCGVEVPE